MKIERIEYHDYAEEHVTFHFRVDPVADPNTFNINYVISAHIYVNPIQSIAKNTEEMLKAIHTDKLGANNLHFMSKILEDYANGNASR